MLNLVLGRAGTGKTEYALYDFCKKMEAGEKELLLIVPEQYSHDAERRLCEVCGDELSLHGEALSFTRLCNRVFLELGLQMDFLDSGGQMLVMHRAIESVASKLKVFGSKGMRVELLERMLEAVQEFKNFGISIGMLENIAGQAQDPLASKIWDLALVMSAYDSLLHIYGGDSADRMTVLADLIETSSVGDAGHIYFDGFNDFTVQELLVIEELLRKNSDITICLTCDADDDNEVFGLPRRTAAQLRRLAAEYGVEVREVSNISTKLANDFQRDAFSERISHGDSLSGSKSAELIFMEKHLFTHEAAEFDGKCECITVFTAPTHYAECEFAAKKVLELVRGGYRWREIAVMARSWEQYDSICENMFEKYGIPFFSSGRADILDKPPVAVIDAALDIATSGWEYRQVFRYIKTGLIGISADLCAELENYVLKWDIRGGDWAREWTLPPSGYGGDVSLDLLSRLNRERLGVTKPIDRLRDGIRGAGEASGKLRALYAFLEEVELPERLAGKAEALEKRGEPRLADEYRQLWSVIVDAMEQVYAILGDTLLTAPEFRKIFALVLSCYDVGVIPVSLDRTALGSISMSRRRDLKCLILLGATDENMPMLSKSGGALSESEREEMSRLGAGMPAGLEESLSREMNMLYSAVTLPSRELVLTYPSGGNARPSFIVKRLETIFDISAADCNVASGNMSGRPSGHLSEHPSGDTDIAAPLAEGSDNGFRTYAEMGKFHRVLSADTAKRLFGQSPSLSPSRVDRFYSCPYQHFLLNGLKLNPRVPAKFDAPMAGTFMHHVLEGASREIKESVGFKNADEQLCLELTEKYIEEFVRDDLFGFEGKNARFIYLFRRLSEDAMRVLSDMVEELKNSDFVPRDFELDFSQLTDDGEGANSYAQLRLGGIVDRVDGWERGEKLFLRIIDYKTGKKSFNLSDVMSGRDMQMLIYLFTLQRLGKARYGNEIVPAGVLYTPARDILMKMPRGASDEDISKARIKELRRGGLLLSDPAVINAMETGDEKKYLPVKISKDGTFAGDSLISQEQIESVEKHVNKMLNNALKSMLAGEIDCSPFYKNENENACVFCDYRAVCAFDEDNGDKRRFVRKMKMAEIWDRLEREQNER